MKNLTALIAALAGVAAARAAHADDLQQWNELGVAADVSDDTAVSLEQHLRFDVDAGQVDSVMPEAGLQHKLREWARIGAGYRLQYQRDKDDEMVVRHRFHVYGKLRRDLGDLRAEWRLQLQEQLRPGEAMSEASSRHSMRNRADLSYRAHKRWTPGGSVELFSALGDGDTIHTDKLWLTADLAYDRKDYKVDVFYRAEVPVADEDDPLLHILGLGVHYDL
jgi:hypothetical protein